MLSLQLRLLSPVTRPQNHQVQLYHLRNPHLECSFADFESSFSFEVLKRSP